MHQRDLLLLYDYNLWANQRLLATAVKSQAAHQAVDDAMQNWANPLN